MKVASAILAILFISSTQVHAWIGRDNRVPVKDSSVYPNKLVGKVTGFGPGTGTIVGERLVLTAAHVAQQFASFFSPGYHNGKPLLGRFNVENIIYPRAYVDNGCLIEETETNAWICDSFDFAFLILKDEPGLPKEYLKLRRFSREDAMKLPINSIGYGSSRSDLQKIQDTNCLGYDFFMSGTTRVVTREDTPLAYDGTRAPVLLNSCDARGGDSGSAVLTKIGEEYFIVGVQVRIQNDISMPLWPRFGGDFTDEWLLKTISSGTQAVPSDLIIDEIEAVDELKALIPSSNH